MLKDMPSRTIDLDHLDTMVKAQMNKTFQVASETAEKYNMKGNIAAGFDIYAFTKIADAMLRQGAV